MDLVTMSTHAGIAAAAKWIAETEAYWLQAPGRFVCWLDVWARMKTNVSQAQAAAEFNVDVKLLRKRRIGLKLETWARWTKGQLPLVRRVLDEAMRLRRVMKGAAADPIAEDVGDVADAETGDALAPEELTILQGKAVAEPETLAETETQAETAREAEFVEAVDWRLLAHAAQLAPEGAWRVWMLMGGRGAGKTRAGAEWVRARVESGEVKRVALVGPTLHDVREVMIEGPSGLKSIAPEGMRPTYEVTRRRLVWPDKGPCAGAVAQVFSAEDPDSLRGPQFDAAWCDEIGAWAKDVETWRTLAFAMRLGRDPRIVATMTPRPRPLVKHLAEKAERGAGAVTMTRAETRANAANLAPDFVRALEEDYGGTTLARQELDGVLVEDAAGALWTRDMIERGRASLDEARGLERVVVAVDPPAGASGRSDACGIVVAGVKDGVVYVLADATVRGLRPAEWGKRVALAAETWDAGVIVAEGNQGGAMVEDVLKLACVGRMRVTIRHASKAKRDRAEPVSALYEQGRVRHARVLKELEDEMCSFGAPAPDGVRVKSPDRVDALVWAVDELVLQRRARPWAEVL